MHLNLLKHSSFSHSANSGRLPFVRTGRPDWSVRKWNARVLRTERTGSGKTGPAHEVGTEREKWAIKFLTARLFVFFVHNTAYQMHFFSLGAKKLASFSNVVDVIQKWLLKPSKWERETLSSKKSEKSAIFANLRREKILVTEENASSPSKSFKNSVSSSSGERKSRRSVGGMLERFVAKSAMLFTWALACNPRKDRVNNRTDRPWPFHYTDENQFFWAGQF